jgi:hypothetical protein
MLTSGNGYGDGYKTLISGALLTTSIDTAVMNQVFFNQREETVCTH